MNVRAFPSKGDRWRSPSSVVYRITSVRHDGTVYGKQELADGRHGAVTRLMFDAAEWSFLTGVRA